MKHTKGPWAVTYDGDGCHCDFGGVVFNTVETDGTNDLEELKANAHLIAAAPDMLEALDNIIAMFEEHEREDMTQNEIDIVSTCKKLLLKAKGGT